MRNPRPQLEHTERPDANGVPWKRPHPRLAYAVTEDGHQLLVHRTDGAPTWSWAFRSRGHGHPCRPVDRGGAHWNLERAMRLCERALERERRRSSRGAR